MSWFTHTCTCTIQSIIGELYAYKFGSSTHAHALIQVVLLIHRQQRQFAQNRSTFSSLARSIVENRSTYVQLESVDSEASIFSMGGYTPMSLISLASAALRPVASSHFFRACLMEVGIRNIFEMYFSKIFIRRDCFQLLRTNIVLYSPVSRHV